MGITVLNPMNLAVSPYAFHREEREPQRRIIEQSKTDNQPHQNHSDKERISAYAKADQPQTVAPIELAEDTNWTYQDPSQLSQETNGFWGSAPRGSLIDLMA